MKNVQNNLSKKLRARNCSGGKRRGIVKINSNKEYFGSTQLEAFSLPGRANAGGIVGGKSRDHSRRGF